MGVGVGVGVCVSGSVGVWRVCAVCAVGGRCGYAGVGCGCVESWWAGAWVSADVGVGVGF